MQVVSIKTSNYDKQWNCMTIYIEVREQEKTHGMNVPQSINQLQKIIYTLIELTWKLPVSIQYINVFEIKKLSHF